MRDTPRAISGDPETALGPVMLGYSLLLCLLVWRGRVHWRTGGVLLFLYTDYLEHTEPLEALRMCALAQAVALAVRNWSLSVERARTLHRRRQRDFA